MEIVNALELRHSLSKIIARLNKLKKPIVLYKGRKPACVLISLEDYNTRFVEKAADEKRLSIMKEINAMSLKSKNKTSAEDLIAELRGRS
jgi:PHD/YefM family antitoxin component YafN of YafNO toxin-antitoxin module